MPPSLTVALSLSFCSKWRSILFLFPYCTTFCLESAFATLTSTILCFSLVLVLGIARLSPSLEPQACPHYLLLSCYSVLSSSILPLHLLFSLMGMISFLFHLVKFWLPFKNSWKQSSLNELFLHFSFCSSITPSTGYFCHISILSHYSSIKLWMQCHLCLTPQAELCVLTFPINLEHRAQSMEFLLDEVKW